MAIYRTTNGKMESLAEFSNAKRKAIVKAHYPRGSKMPPSGRTKFMNTEHSFGRTTATGMDAPYIHGPLGYKHWVDEIPHNRRQNMALNEGSPAMRSVKKGMIKGPSRPNQPLPFGKRNTKSNRAASVVRFFGKKKMRKAAYAKRNPKPMKMKRR